MLCLSVCGGCCATSLGKQAGHLAGHCQFFCTGISRISGIRRPSSLTVSFFCLFILHFILLYFIFCSLPVFLLNGNLWKFSCLLVISISYLIIFIVFVCKIPLNCRRLQQPPFVFSCSRWGFLPPFYPQT